MTTLKPIILFDIDGTVADLSHRLHYITDGKHDWASFNKAIPLDTPIPQAVWLQQLLRLHAKMPVFFASGRSENERTDTVNQLNDFRCFYDRLYMRPAGDMRADYIIKREILDQIRADGFDPFIVIDDRQSVVDMWRENGLFVLQCDPNRGECRSDVLKFHESIEYPLTIMIGPSGAGKSTWVKTELASRCIDYDYIISSDALRMQICGDFQDQTQNARVFQTMHELAQTRLKLGLPVILDATHIKRADRLKSALLVPDDIPVRYVVINRSLEEKRKTAGWRSSVIVGGKLLVDKHDEVFKSNLKDILKGDDLPNVTILDLRK